jgi:hypothetical protein
MEKPKDILAVNMTGQPMNPEDWKKGTKAMVIGVASFVGNYTQSTTCVSNTHDGVYLIDYVLGGRIQPTIRVEGNKVIIPRGTDLELSLRLLEEGF